MTLPDYFSLAWFFLSLGCCVAISVRDGRIVALERANDYLRQDVAALVKERDEAHALINQHTAAASALLAEVEVLERRNDWLESIRTRCMDVSATALLARDLADAKDVLDCRDRISAP